MIRAILAVGLIGFGLCVASPAAVWAQAAVEDPAHEELRQLRRGLLEAVKQNDVEGMLSHLDRDAVVTFMDATQCRGHDAVRDYFQRMLEGEQRVVESYNIEAEVKELTTLYDEDAGTAYGTATTDFHLTDGRQFAVTGPWTATAVRRDGKWLIASFHSSANMFDNPILAMTKQWILYTGIIAAAVGLLLGVVLTVMVKRKPAAAS